MADAPFAGHPGSTAAAPAPSHSLSHASVHESGPEASQFDSLPLADPNSPALAQALLPIFFAPSALSLFHPAGEPPFSPVPRSVPRFDQFNPEATEENRMIPMRVIVRAKIAALSAQLMNSGFGTCS
jgi:hypothetical protein